MTFQSFYQLQVSPLWRVCNTEETWEIKHHWTQLTAKQQASKQSCHYHMIGHACSATTKPGHRHRLRDTPHIESHRHSISAVPISLLLGRNCTHAHNYKGETDTGTFKIHMACHCTVDSTTKGHCFCSLSVHIIQLCNTYINFTNYAIFLIAHQLYHTLKSNHRVLRQTHQLHQYWCLGGGGGGGGTKPY